MGTFLLCQLISLMKTFIVIIISPLLFTLKLH